MFREKVFKTHEITKTRESQDLQPGFQRFWVISEDMQKNYIVE
jgi:hypothetical protein